MTLRHLQIFKTVCDCQCITTAAEKLNMTQPAVSIAIKELETFYETRLFDRGGRRLALTEAGVTLQRYATTVLEQFEESTAVLREGRFISEYRFGVTVSLAETILPELVTRLKDTVPDVHFQIQVENTPVIEQLLAENQIDFAIVDCNTSTTCMTRSLLYTDHMVVVCAPSLYAADSITIDELAHQPLLLREKESGNRCCVDAVFQNHGYTPHPILESSSTLSIINLAKLGLGFAVVPSSLSCHICKSGELHTVRVTDDSFKRFYYLLYHNNKHLTPQLITILESIKPGCCEHKKC